MGLRINKVVGMYIVLVRVWSGGVDYIQNLNSPGIILGVSSTNETWRYIVMSSLIGWAYTRSVPCSQKHLRATVRMNFTEVIFKYIGELTDCVITRLKSIFLAIKLLPVY